MTQKVWIIGLFDMVKDYSVLIPLWYKERAEYLKASIESMSSQTILPAEFVLVRDHEIPDELTEIIEESAGGIPIKYVDAYELFGKGLGAIRAKGVENCSYELIACMDSDDISFSDRCEKQLAIFDKYPDVAIVGGTIAEFSRTFEKIMSYRLLPEKHIDIVKFAKLRCPFNQPAVMFRKSVILNVGNYDVFLNACEDYELWFRALKSGYVSYNIPEPVIYFRAGDHLIEHRGEKKHYQCYVKLKKQMRKEKFINWFDCQVSITVQSVFYYSPLFLKKLIYMVLRRK
jgi:glycosyltransferase involved in cell wall biosynthesis